MHFNKVILSALQSNQILTYRCQRESKACFAQSKRNNTSRKAYFETRTGLGLGPEKKTRTREKPGLVLGPAFEKPGLDNRKPGLKIEKYLVR